MHDDFQIFNYLLASYMVLTNLARTQRYLLCAPIAFLNFWSSMRLTKLNKMNVKTVQPNQTNCKGHETHAYQVTQVSFLTVRTVPFEVWLSHFVIH